MVTVQSNLAQTYNFNVAATGTDAGHIAHSTPVAFSSLFTFTVADTSGTQALKAGQTATYNLTVTPVGSTTFSSAVTFTCSGLPAGATCSKPQISAGASGTQSVSLTISTLGPNAAALRPVAQKGSTAPFLLWVSSVGMVIGGFVRRSAARKGMTATLSIGVVIASSFMMSSCGGSGGGGGGGGVSVSVSPRTAAPFPTQQQQFSAMVNGSTNTQVSWQVNGATGGSAAAGTIDSTGLYTAPTAVPNPAAVTVSAVAQADLRKWGSATVTIQAPTPAGAFTITVTATAGSVTQNTSATLVVQ
jgi:VCBS repeat-containing protein